MSDESYDSDKEEYEKLGSESGSAGRYGTGLGGLLCILVIRLVVTLYADNLCDSDGGLLALPYKNIGEAGTVECTGDANIFSIV